MLWIETPNELVNLNNFDRVFLQQEDDWSEYEYVLEAEKQVGGNGEERGAYLLRRLCFGSEAHCRDQLGLIIEALRFQRKTLVTVVNGEPKPQPEEEPGTICSHCGHPLAWHAAADNAPNSGITCAEPGCRCKVFGIAAEDFDF